MADMINDYEILIDLLRDVNRGLGRYVKEVLNEHDIPITIGLISRQITSEPGITISELARRTGIAKSHISKNIQELEKRGWVEKREDAADQRLLHLYLTPRAQQHLAMASADVRQRINQLVTGIPPEKTGELISGLTQIKVALDQVYQGRRDND